MQLSTRLVVSGLFLVLLLGACAPSDEANVVGYLLEEQMGGPYDQGVGEETATLTGEVVYQGEPQAGVSVVVAQRKGTPHSDVTDAQGRYRIEGIPPGQYVPAAVGPGFEETALTSAFGVPWLITLDPGETEEAPPIEMIRHVAAPLPSPLPAAVDLQIGATDVITAPFPNGAIAARQAISFTRDGVVVDTVRLYRPLGETGPSTALPLIFASYPGTVQGWEPVSVAFAFAGHNVLAISPVAARGLDVDAHTQDARVLLALARGGHLRVDLSTAPAVAVGGSFSSAILHRLLRDEADQFRAWITAGGITNAFRSASEFYAGTIALPEQYRLVVPALGAGNLYPVGFLRYSPVFTAAYLPPTLIIHTDADIIIPIDHAYELEAALRTAGVPVDVFYYEDVSHYLQIGEDLTEAGQEMYYLIINFVERYAEMNEE